MLIFRHFKPNFQSGPAPLTQVFFPIRSWTWRVFQHHHLVMWHVIWFPRCIVPLKEIEGILHHQALKKEGFPLSSSGSVVHRKGVVEAIMVSKSGISSSVHFGFPDVFLKCHLIIPTDSPKITNDFHIWQNDPTCYKKFLCHHPRHQMEFRKRWLRQSLLRCQNVFGGRGGWYRDFRQQIGRAEISMPQKGLNKWKTLQIFFVAKVWIWRGY